MKPFNLHFLRQLPIHMAICLSINLSLGKSYSREGIETIKVTARKQEQSAFDVPLSLSVLHGDSLNQLRSSGLDIRFMNNRTPSLQVMSGFGRVYPYFFIRGLGNTDFDMNASQPVSVMHDGIVFENPWLKGHPIFDVERVEVLRGPQGTLFGRNTPAGIIKVESALPTWETEGYSRLSYGSFDSTNFEGVLSGPLIPSKLAARASLLLQQRNHWIDNIHTKQDNAYGGYHDLAGRVQFLWKPTKKFSGRFKFHKRKLDSAARVFRANSLIPGSTQLRPDLKRDQVSLDAKNSLHLSSEGFSSELRYDKNSFTLISLTGGLWLDGLSQGDLDGGFGSAGISDSGPYLPIPFSAETADGISALAQLSQELRLEHKPSNILNWRIGAFYFHEDLDMGGFSYDTLNNSTLNGQIRQTQLTNAWALFSAMNYYLAEDWEISAGIRLSKDTKNYTSQRYLSPMGADPMGPIGKNYSAFVPSWDLSVRHEMTPEAQPYARIASSFRAPSIRGRVLFDDDITVADTERIISIETGLKLRLWQQRLSLDLAAYYFWLDDQQLMAGSGTDNANRLLNAKQTIGQGIEAEGALALDYGFDLGFGLSYNYTRLNDPDLFLQPCGSNCTVLDPPGPIEGTVSIYGNPLPQAPLWIGNIHLSYTYQMFNGSRFILSTDWIYRSRLNFFLYESREFRDDNLIEGGLRLTWLSPAEDWQVIAFGRNILNDFSPTGGVDFNNLTSFINEPPVWGLGFMARF